MVVPSIAEGKLTGNLVYTIIALVGTTIAPWQLFFQQSAIADKKLRFKDIKFERADTLFGAFFTIFVAAAMMIVGIALYKNQIPYENAAQMATVLGGSFGNFFKYAILIMMVNAAILGANAISLSSAWAYSEVMGTPCSLEMPFSKAKAFYIAYTFIVCLAAAIVLIPKVPLQLIIIGVQVFAGLMLPSSLVFLQLLLNDKELLGKATINKPWNNWINWTIIFVFFVLSATLSVQILLPNLFPQ